MSGKITTHETIAMFLLQAILSPALKSPRAGAQTSIFCAIDESLEAVRSDDARKLLFVSKNFFYGFKCLFFWKYDKYSNKQFLSIIRIEENNGLQPMSICFMKLFSFFRFPASTLWTATRARWPSRAALPC